MDFLDYINRSTILEYVSGNQPKNFWLVLDVSDRDHDKEKMMQLAAGNLIGLKGISSHREIIVNWFTIARNAFIVMPAAQVLANNHIEEIQYDNPQYLVSNDMDVLYRVFDKRKDKYGHQGMMGNVQERVLPILASNLNDYTLNYLISHYGIQHKLGEHWTGSGIKSVEDLAKWTLDALIKTTKGIAQHSLEDVEKVSLADVTIACFEALRKIGKLYSDEYEWIVRGSSFNIPRGSRMVIGMDLAVKNDIEKNNSANKSFGNQWAYEGIERMLEMIAEHKLNQYYNLTFIDGSQYKKIISGVRDRRVKTPKQ